MLSGFEDPWEHVRLLSDAPRTRVLVDLLRRHAPDARVVEVGCGTGWLACVAARLGARHVYAVEPTSRWEDAQRLVEANGLGSRVTVLPGMVEELDPRPVDLAFSELLNADPFYEGVLDAMDGVASWLAPGGRLAPRRLRVWTALVRDGGSAREVRQAGRALRALCDEFSLDDAGLLRVLEAPGPYTYVTSSVELASEPALVCDLPLGAGVEPPEELTVEVPVAEPGPVGGAVVWFEADYDEGLALDNAPGAAGHWGHLVSAWPRERGARAGERVGLRVCIDDRQLEVHPLI